MHAGAATFAAVNIHRSHRDTNALLILVAIPARNVCMALVQSVANIAHAFAVHFLLF